MLEDRAQDDDAAQPAAQAVSKSGFYLQLGSFSKAGKAEEMSSKLVKAGLAADSLQVIASGALNRLLRGPFETRKEAQKAERDLPRGFGIKPIVVHR
jgi:rare lipoprotein A